MKFRKWNRIIHRDLGYIFCGMSIIYGISGIALNHLDDWNPDYNITYREISLQSLPEKENINKDYLIGLLNDIDQSLTYKSHYYPSEGLVKIFLKMGSLTIHMDTGKAFLELLKKRPVLREFNFLHYNKPKKAWTWFSDIFAVSLVLIAVSGLFMIRGSKGITGRGAWLTAIGILIPLLLLLIYM